VSIEQMVQDGQPTEGQAATVVMLTHRAREGAVQAALSELARAGICVDDPQLLRVEDA
jgi:homoserine dehydrogenase